MFVVGVWGVLLVGVGIGEGYAGRVWSAGCWSVMALCRLWYAVH